ncbi:MAG: GH116 family glycosyl-hydrolase, partial [Anaerolineae bacterium]|nr:GH116 family glycosyl-hydrolase [Anaerolineae bacterium]
MAVDPFAIPEAAWRRRLDQTLKTPGRPSPLALRAIPLRRFPAVLARLIADARERRRSGWDAEGLLLTGSSVSAPGPHQGVPLGGIGAGTVGRGWRGEFRRWQRRPSFYQQWVAWASQFSLFVAWPGQPAQAQVLYPGRPPDRRLRAWQWGMDARCAVYHALYPRAWTVYDQPLPGVRLTCRQLSPIIPHNYRESSYPVGHFLWRVENLTDQEATVGLMFTWQNGPEVSAVHRHQTFRQPLADGRVAAGVALVGVHRQPQSCPPGQRPALRQPIEDPATFAVAALADDGVEVTCCPCFAADGDGAALWQDFSRDGRLDGTALDVSDAALPEPPAAAVAATVTVPARGVRHVAFALAWDMPVVRSGFGTAYHRRYTRFYGAEGSAAPAIAADALRCAADWEAQVVAWQQPILDDPDLPTWYKMALFNELYYIADGGTWWVHEPVPSTIAHEPKDKTTPLSHPGRGAGGEGSPLSHVARGAGGEGAPLS